MANRRFNQFQGTLEREVCKLYGKVAIGATGAPTLDADYSKGIASISRSAQGVYLVTLSDKYWALFDFNAFLLESGDEDITFKLQAVSMSAKTLTIGCYTGATLTDPSDGSVLHFSAELKNTSLVK